MSPQAAVVIIGSGQAGGRAAEALRLGGHAGRITLIGDEPHAPYERPALSKEFLSSAAAEKLAWVRPGAWYTEAGVTALHGRKVVRIDRARHLVELDEGSPVEYQSLVLTTGARPRQLAVEGVDHPLVSYLRTIEDSQRLQQRLLPGARIVVIGAGFIGMEVAATAVSRGCTVTVLELANVPMARAIPPQLGDFYADFHRRKGVDLRVSTAVRRITDERGRALIHTDSGATILADAVVVGTGVVPNVELAHAAGLEIDNGVVVDEYGRTGDSRIYAAGDVTTHFNPLLGRRVRLESWQNAQNQAIAVAKVMAGGTVAFAEVPWFWTDQFDMNLQMAGAPDRWDRLVFRGEPAERSFTVFHLADGKPVAVTTVNAPRDMRFGRMLIERARAVDPALLADKAVKLQDLTR